MIGRHPQRWVTYLLLGWWVYAMVANALGSVAPVHGGPGIGALMLYPLAWPLSRVLSASAALTVLNDFVTWSWWGFIVGGILYARGVK